MTTTSPASSPSSLQAAPRSRPWLTRFLMVAILAVLLKWIYWPSLYAVVEKWRTDGNWSHGWLVPLFSLYLLYDRREQLAQVRFRSSYWGLVGLLLGLSAYFFFIFVVPMGYPRELSLVLVIGSLVVLLCGWQVFRYAWFPVAYLGLAIPVPDGLYVSVTMPLRRLAASIATLMLSTLVPGLHAEASGVVIDYAYRGTVGSLDVEEACSGMRLMMAFVALGLAMAYLGDRPLWQRALMVLACVPIAVFCNILRVFMTGLLNVFGYRDWSEGSAHELLGLAMLPIALGLFYLIGFVLDRLFVELEDEPSAADAAS